MKKLIRSANLNVRRSCTKRAQIGLWFTHAGHAMTVRVEVHWTPERRGVAPHRAFLKQWLPSFVVSLVVPGAPGHGCLGGLGQAVLFWEAREPHVGWGGDCVKFTRDALHSGVNIFKIKGAGDVKTWRHFGVINDVNCLLVINTHFDQVLWLLIPPQRVLYA